jgi:hypothetical protein
MPRILLPLFVALLLAFAGVACGDGDDDNDEGDNDGSPSASARPTNDPDETSDASETPDGDNTPAAEVTPDPNATPAPTGFDATPSAQGTRATIIDDPSGWFQQNFPGVSPGEQTCQYNVAEVLVVCEGEQYAPDPPLVSPGIECSALLVEGERVALRCTSLEPVFTAYYDIQE